MSQQQHESGRETDALVARVVMGLDTVSRSHEGSDWEIARGMTRRDDFMRCKRCLTSRKKASRTRWDDSAPCVPRVPAYSTDIAAAMLVVERMRDLWTKYTEQQGDRPFRDWSPPPFHDRMFFESLQRHADRRWPWAFLYVTPLAICRAALAAVEQQS